MSEFKVGDEVKAISKSFGWGVVKEGDLGIVQGLNGGEIQVNFPNQEHWSCLAKDLELAAPRWSIYNNDLPWEKLSDKQKGKLLLAAHSGVKFEGVVRNPPTFDCEKSPYTAIKPEPVKPEPTMAELFVADWPAHDTGILDICADKMIAKGWNKPC